MRVHAELPSYKELRLFIRKRIALLSALLKVALFVFAVSFVRVRVLLVLFRDPKIAHLSADILLVCLKQHSGPDLNGSPELRWDIKSHFCYAAYNEARRLL